MSTLHLLTVADVEDSSIGAGCAVDQDAVHDFMKAAAQQIGIDFHNMGKLREKQFELNAIKTAVTNASPASDDIIVFHYSGHGFRSESKLSHWPAIALGHTFTGAIEGLDIDWIYRTLFDKNPRMLMVMVDCCNNTFEDYETEIHEARTKSFASPERIAGLKTLFESFSGTVLGMGCEVGETSLGTVYGGHFTTKLLETIEDRMEANGSSVSWSEIMSITSQPQITEFSNETHIQEPVWEVTSPQKGQDGGIEGGVSIAAKSFGRTRLVPFSGKWKKGNGTATSSSSATPTSTTPPVAKFCSGCGNPLAAGSRFCGHCGAAVGQIAPASTPAPTPALTSTPTPAATPATARPSPTQRSARTTSTLDAMRQRQEDRAKAMEERAAARMARMKDRLNRK